MATTIRSNLSGHDLIVGHAIALFFFMGLLGNSITLIFNLQGTWLDSQMSSGYIRFTHLIVFVVCTYSAFYNKGHFLFISNKGISWDVAPENKKNGGLAFLYIMLLIVYNPIYILGLNHIIWMIFHLILIGLFTKVVLEGIDQHHENLKIKQDNMKLEQEFKAVFKDYNRDKLHDYQKEHKLEITFESLLFLIAEYNSKVYLQDNFDSILEGWELDIDWSKYRSLDEFKTSAYNSLKKVLSS